MYKLHGKHNPKDQEELVFCPDCFNKAGGVEDEGILIPTKQLRIDEIRQFERIYRALLDIDFFRFQEVVGPHYKSLDYIKEKYGEFSINPIAFCYSRNPIEPGLKLIEKAMDMAKTGKYDSMCDSMTRYLH